MTDRLLAIAIKNWASVDGYAVGHGIDLGKMPLHRVCNFVYWLFTRNGQDTDIAKFDAKLWRPPVGAIPDARSPWSAENETKAFQALKSQLAGGK